jgi:non-ribosomal peptide synthetase component F
VTTTVLEAYAHQDLPFEQLVDALRLERKIGQIPLVSVLFVLQNMPQQAPNFPGLTVISNELEIPNAKFDLALVLTERDQEINGYVDYRADLFDPHTITTLIQHFTVLLQSIVTSPDIPIEQLEMLSKEENEQRLKKEGMRQEADRRKLKVTKRRVITLTGHDFESIGG